MSVHMYLHNYMYMYMYTYIHKPQGVLALLHLPPELLISKYNDIQYSII